LLPSIRKDIHWKALASLWFGCLLGTPLGVKFLASVPVAPMKIALALVVLVAVGLLWSGYVRRSFPTTVVTIMTGGVEGLIYGPSRIVAPPVILFFLNSPAGASISRASLIAFMIGTDSMGLAFLAREGLIKLDSAYRFLMLVPALLIGQWIGACSFKRADP